LAEVPRKLINTLYHDIFNLSSKTLEKNKNLLYNTISNGGDIMKVILKQDIKGVGKKDQVINAADGYARNFLFPKDLAIPADTGNMNNLKAKKDSESFRRGEDKKESEALAEKMKDMKLVFKVKAGENGRLFGTITSKEIAETLKKDYDIVVDKKKILLPDGIKVAGTQKIDIKLSEGVMAKLTIMVTTI